MDSFDQWYFPASAFGLGAALFLIGFLTIFDGQLVIGFISGTLALFVILMGMLMWPKKLPVNESTPK